MKKLIIVLLALALAFACVSCDDKENPSGDGSTPSASQGGNNGGINSTDGGDKDSSSASGEKCLVCFDYDSPNDRKCDECGNWVYPDGEAWTAEVPENLRVAVADGNFYYEVEKIGEEFYVKMWSDKASMEKGDIPYEDFVRLTERYARYLGNENQSEWSKSAFQTKYADVHELFAVEVLKNLGGIAVSTMLDDCKDVSSSGNEVVAGKECVIKEYASVFGTEYKVWFWNNMPLKKIYRDADDTEYGLLWEIYEWDTSITEFSTDIPQ